MWAGRLTRRFMERVRRPALQIQPLVPGSTPWIGLRELSRLRQHPADVCAQLLATGKTRRNPFDRRESYSSAGHSRGLQTRSDLAPVLACHPAMSATSTSLRQRKGVRTDLVLSSAVDFREVTACRTAAVIWIRRTVGRRESRDRCSGSVCRSRRWLLDTGSPKINRANDMNRHLGVRANARATSLSKPGRTIVVGRPQRAVFRSSPRCSPTAR